MAPIAAETLCVWCQDSFVCVSERGTFCFSYMLQLFTPVDDEIVPAVVDAQAQDLDHDTT